MTEKLPFKIRVSPDGTYFDDEQYTHIEEDVLYVKVADHPIETAIRLLTEQGCHVSINVDMKSDNDDGTSGWIISSPASRNKMPMSNDITAPCAMNGWI